MTGARGSGREEALLAEHERRRNALVIVAANLIWVPPIIQAWGDLRLLALFGGLMVFCAVFHPAVSLVLTPRIGVKLAETIRLPVTLGVLATVGHFTGWGLAYWLWLPFLIGAGESPRYDNRGFIWALNIGTVAFLGLALGDDGPWLGLGMMLLSAYWHFVGQENRRFSRALLDEGVEREEKLAIFNTELTAQREALAAANTALSDQLRLLRETQDQLVTASRHAGMAEIATSILHNVGNVLNGVNVSAQALTDQARGLPADGLRRATTLLEQQGDLGAFFATAQGRTTVLYLGSLANALDAEKAGMLEEIKALCGKVEHINAIVAAQQSNARHSGVVERVKIEDLVRDALRLQEASSGRHGVTVDCDLECNDEIECDRHLVFQILTNLLTNAKQAVKSREEDRAIRVHSLDAGGDEVVLEVHDNGVGVASEHMARLFTHGFTTKQDGHGFGLHASACNAASLGGSLSCTSDGAGRGATFRLKIPRRPPPSRGAGALRTVDPVDGPGPRRVEAAPREA